MESLIVLFALACLLTFIGGILGIVAFAKIGTLRAEMRELEAKVARLRRVLSDDTSGETEQGEGVVTGRDEVVEVRAGQSGV